MHFGKIYAKNSVERIQNHLSLQTPYERNDKTYLQESACKII